jgi:hypothetical protein
MATLIAFYIKRQENQGTSFTCVHYMVAGICKAISLVFFLDILEFVCHFHLFGDTEKELLDTFCCQVKQPVKTCGHNKDSLNDP